MLVFGAASATGLIAPDEALRIRGSLQVLLIGIHHFTAVAGDQCSQVLLLDLGIEKANGAIKEEGVEAVVVIVVGNAPDKVSVEALLLAIPVPPFWGKTISVRKCFQPAL